MKDQMPSPRPEVDLNPHSDLPAGGVISTEISPAMSPPETVFAAIEALEPVVSFTTTEPAPLPFGVYLGTAAPPETLKP